RRNVIRTLLGPEAEREYCSIYDESEQRFMYFPEEKRAGVADINLKYSKVLNDLAQKADGQWNASLWHDIRETRKALRNELATVLSAEEIRQFAIRESMTADQLRVDFMFLENPSSKEFESIFDARAEFEEQF